ncbi:ATP-binding protein [Rhizobium sp. LjRoot30]|uniref:sensor histidine kinase n=1 Tax=Rhizobium sp. LjRoot30 TaxID=3342320 RepID=UPI003ED11A51
MTTFRLTREAHGSPTLGHDVAVGFAALLLAVAVFWVDTFTSIESAIAVLYVIVLLLAANMLTRQGIVVATMVLALLTTVSYLATHGLAPDLPAVLRLAVSLAALFITGALLLRDSRSRSALLASNTALRDSELRYRSIFEQSRVALWERDYSRVRAFLMSLKASGVSSLAGYVQEHPDAIADCIALTRTVASNHAARELLGNVGEDSASHSTRQYLAPDDATFLDLMQAIFDQQPSFEGKGNLIAADGQTKLVLMSLRLPADPELFDRVVVGMFDITEREQTQKALLEAQAELTRAARAATVGALSASLAHELNQPLGALVVNAQTMLRWINRDPPDLAAVARSAERMIRDSKRASDIIHNTRSMLSHELRTAEKVDLAELIRETQALMEHDLNREGIAVDVIYGRAARTISAVRIELQQVLINLITNAIQAMTLPGTTRRNLVIETRRQDDSFICVSVRDFGPGIPPDVMARLFAPFFTTKPDGMGMGLSICRSILEARGGELLARNHADGGAVFDIVIPAGGEI